MPSDNFTFKDFLPLIQEEPEYNTISRILLEMEERKDFLRGVNYLINKKFTAVEAYLTEHCHHYMIFAIKSKNKSIIDCLMEVKGVEDYVFGEGKELLRNAIEENGLKHQFAISESFYEMKKGVRDTQSLVSNTIDSIFAAEEAEAKLENDLKIFSDSLPLNLSEENKALLLHFRKTDPSALKSAIEGELTKRNNQESKENSSLKKASM